MSTALAVVIEELLSGPTDSELEIATRAVSKRGVGSVAKIAAWEAITSWADFRRDYYLKPKSPEERVTTRLHFGDRTSQHLEVLVDGENHMTFAQEEHAEIYRLGLIQQLKSCLCIEGCSVNRECPIHGDRT